MPYEFVDINEQPLRGRLPLETVINDVNLDRQIAGFRTLTVGGRELLGRDIESRNYKTLRAGKRTQTSRNYRQALAPNVLISSAITSRTLIVRYMLKASSDELFRRAFEDLNYFANQEEVPIRFSDDPDFYFVGTLTEVEEVDPASNNVVSSFQIECMDPFKYALRAQEWRFLTTDSFRQTGYYPVVVERIEVRPKSTVPRLQIMNKTTGAMIAIDRQIASGTNVIMDMVGGEIKSAAGVNLMLDLNLFSDFEDFGVDYGHVVETNTAADVVVTYRQRML